MGAIGELSPMCRLGQKSKVQHCMLALVPYHICTPFNSIIKVLYDSQLTLEGKYIMSKWLKYVDQVFMPCLLTSNQAGSGISGNTGRSTA